MEKRVALGQLVYSGALGSVEEELLGAPGSDIWELRRLGRSWMGFEINTMFCRSGNFEAKRCHDARLLVVTRVGVAVVIGRGLVSVAVVSCK
jgi:hypothetical protein